VNTTAEANDSHQRRPLLAGVEVALIFLLLFAFAGSPPPGDDEVHYLGKAKHYWNPEWLADDFFLETPDAHVVFNWTIGWLTLFFPLTAVAWIGRCVAWLSLALAWRRLSWTIVPRPLVSLLTMALFLVFQEYGTAAREWIVGGVEAKCFAYVFVILGLEQLVRGRWHWVWPLMGVGAAFHVLVGGWAVVAALLAWAATKERPSFASMFPALVAGGLLSLPGLVPAVFLTWNADPELVREANQIYVFERLNHHLLFYDFPWRYKIQFLSVLAAWLVVCFLTRGNEQRMPLRRFVLGSIVIGVAGIALDQLAAGLNRPALAAAVLRYYWYRLPDMIVPAGLSFALAEWAFGPRKWPPQRYTQALMAVLILAPLVVLSWDIARQRADGRPTAEIQGQIGEDDPFEYSDWLKTCAWARLNTRPSARFLIPPHIQSFRWHAQRSEVVSRKDIPQNAAGIVQWRERLAKVHRWYSEVGKHGLTDELRAQLLHLASPAAYDIQYVIVGRRYGIGPLPLPVAYATSRENPSFVVYRVPPGNLAEDDSTD